LISLYKKRNKCFERKVTKASEIPGLLYRGGERVGKGK